VFEMPTSEVGRWVERDCPTQCEAIQSGMQEQQIVDEAGDGDLDRRSAELKQE